MFECFTNNRVFTYLVYKPNPIIQIFYVFLVLGGSSLFIFSGYSLLIDSGLSPIHYYTYICSLLITLLCFYISSTSDPGEIKLLNHEIYGASYEYDDIFYIKGYLCATCKVIKAPRSKHCRICNRCVARFDHHCPWVNNDIGLLNLRYFLLFLLMTVVQIFYTFYLSYNICKDIYHSSILSLYYNEISYLEIMEFIIERIPTIFGLAFFTGFVGIFVLAFLFYHLYLIARNTTSNEVGRPPANPNVVSVYKWIYNKGIIMNFYEVLFPYAYLQLNKLK